MPLSRSRPAVAASDHVGDGGMALIHDGNTAVLCVAGSKVSVGQMAFLIRRTSGIVCVAITSERAKGLDLSPQAILPFDPMRPVFTESVDAAVGVTTGISAADRVATVKVLASPEGRPRDLAEPGHVFPVVVHPNGVLGRAKHAEASWDLVALAGCGDGAVFATVMNDDGSVSDRTSWSKLAAEFAFPTLSITEVVKERLIGHLELEEVETTSVEIRGVRLRAQVFETATGEGVLLRYGDANGYGEVFVHRTCTVGDILGSDGCSCHEELHASIDRIIEIGAGTLVQLPSGTVGGCGRLGDQDLSGSSNFQAAG